MKFPTDLHRTLLCSPSSSGDAIDGDADLAIFFAFQIFGCI